MTEQDDLTAETSDGDEKKRSEPDAKRADFMRYAGGLGKKSDYMRYAGGLGKKADYMRYAGGLGKKADYMRYAGGLGKKADYMRYAGGLGKKADYMRYAGGLGKRADYMRYAGGLGKKADYMRYAGGLGKKADYMRYAGGLGKKSTEPAAEKNSESKSDMIRHKLLEFFNNDYPNLGLKRARIFRKWREQVSPSSGGTGGGSAIKSFMTAPRDGVDPYRYMFGMGK